MNITDKIVFSRLEVNQGKISCLYQDDTAAGELYFHLQPAVNPGNDLIAIALSTLCGRNRYASITFDFPISAYCYEKVKFFCNAEIITPSVTESAGLSPRTRNALSFSGGFDSLAAKYLMPENTVLVSMDFGGKFAREGAFFKTFDTNIVETNVLETHLRRNSWSFMGIASILFSDHLQIKYHTFGGIMESGIANFDKKAAENNTFPPFEAAGMQNAPYVTGITEIGTAMVLLTFAKDLIEGSLESLANNGESKKYRKQLISSLAAARLGAEFKIPVFDTPNNKWTFGKSFADDFLCFYFAKHAGEEATLKLFQAIPQDVMDAANRLSLKFFERINPDFLENFPKELLPGLLRKSAKAGLIPYTRQDWNELEEVLAILRKYHQR